jgi:hypothetical protein
MGGVRVRGLRALTDRVRVEFGGQLERGRRRVSLGRVAVTALALDLSVLLSVVNGAAVGRSRWAGARASGVSSGVGTRTQTTSPNAAPVGPPRALRARGGGLAHGAPLGLARGPRS